MQTNPTSSSVKLYAITRSWVKPAASVPKRVAMPPARMLLATPVSRANSSRLLVKVAVVHCATRPVCDYLKLRSKLGLSDEPPL